MSADLPPLEDVRPLLERLREKSLTRLNPNSGTWDLTADLDGPAAADLIEALYARMVQQHSKPPVQTDPAISGLMPVSGHAEGCGAHDDYCCDCKPPVDGAVETRCNIPPAGWHCSRTPGHDGPCAASPERMSGLDEAIYQLGVMYANADLDVTARRIWEEGPDGEELAMAEALRTALANARSEPRS